jgi:hypothetical protein
MDYSEIFIWYCCIIGINGNILVFYLFIKRLSSLKRNVCLEIKNVAEESENSKEKFPVILPSTSTDAPQNSGVYINKNILLDLNHNWTLYLYFLGIIISDIVVLINWILSKVNIDYEANFRIRHNLDYDTEKEAAFLSFQDYLSFSSSYKIKSKHTNETFAPLYSNQNEYAGQKNLTFFVNLDYILKTYDNHTNFLKIKIIDLQGVCQIYYFLTNASLHCVFAYILISVLDRLVKRSGIKKDLSISNKEESIQKLIMTTNEDNIETSSLFEKRQHNYSINTNIKYFSYKSLSKTTHSPIIRQVFGKTSALFICIFVFYLLFHLLWIYGAVFETVIVGTFDEYMFHLLNTNRIDHKKNTLDFNNTFQNQIGSFQITALRPHCQLLNLKNYLPMFVMSFDLFLLLIIGIAQFVTTVILIFKCYNKREKKVKLKKQTIKSNNLKNHHKPLGNNVVIMTSIFTFLFAMPSVITRNILMNIIMSLKIFPKPLADLNDNVELNFADFNQTYQNNQTHVIGSILEKNYTIEDYIPFLNNFLNWLDFFLLISSSHKFFIFLFHCNLININLMNFFSTKNKTRV